MLNELDESLKALLTQELPRVVERIEADGFDISFDVPNRDFRARLTRPTLSLYLFNIQENRELRGRVWNVTRQNGHVSTRRPAVRLDCGYMVTAWSNEVEDEHRLLTGATRVLFRNPVLPSDVLQGALADLDYDVFTEVAQPQSFKDVVDIWSVLDNDLHPSVRVTVTIPLELEVEYTRPSVTERRIDFDDPDWHPRPAGPLRVTGRVERSGEPVVGALVRADNASAHTDDRGEYKLENVTPGKQLLWVRLGEAFHQFEVDLPDESLITLPGDANPPDAPSDSTGDPPRGSGRVRNTRRGQQN